MARGCLKCGIPLDDTTNFCPRCGTATERGFGITPVQDAGLNEYKQFRKEIEERDRLIRQQGFYYDCGGPAAHMAEYAHPGNCPRCGASLVKRDRSTGRVIG